MQCGILYWTLEQKKKGTRGKNWRNLYRVGRIVNNNVLILISDFDKYAIVM